MNLTHGIELTRHRTIPALAGLVAGVIGLTERAPGVVERRQPAGSLLPLVFSFGPPLRVAALSEGVGADRSYGSFFAGFSTGYADTRFERTQDSVQVFLTPLGMRTLLHTPGSELAHRVTAVGDVVRALGLVIERLADMPTCQHRLRRGQLRPEFLVLDLQQPHPRPCCRAHRDLAVQPARRAAFRHF